MKTLEEINTEKKEVIADIEHIKNVRDHHLETIEMMKEAMRDEKEKLKELKKMEEKLRNTE